MRPTRLPVLVVVCALVGVAAYLLTRSFYGDLPTLPTYGPVFLVLLAAAEGYVAGTTAARLAGKPKTEPIHPITVARIAALAKSTLLIAAVATGAYAGFLGYVARLSSPAASHDLRVAVGGVVCSVALGAAAWWMERVCRVKSD